MRLPHQAAALLLCAPTAHAAHVVDIEARCNHTWYFLDAYDGGTPVRCSSESGMLICATTPDGNECQWGKLYETPAPYQPLVSVVSGPSVRDRTHVSCNHWQANDGSDPCTVLGCRDWNASSFCHPERPLLPPLEAHSGLLFGVYLNVAGQLMLSDNYQNPARRDYHQTVMVAVSGGLVAVVCLVCCSVSCWLARCAARRENFRLTRSVARLEDALKPARYCPATTAEWGDARLGRPHEEAAGVADDSLDDESRTAASTHVGHADYPPKLLPSLPPWDVMFVDD